MQNAMKGMESLTRQVLALAGQTRDIRGFLAAFGPVLDCGGLHASRLFAGVQSLHPEFRARSYLWRSGWKVAEVTSWPHGLVNRAGYYDSPDYHVHRSGKAFRSRLEERAPQTECDLYGSLKREGFTDYLMVPLRFADGTINTLAFATEDPAGFATDTLDMLDALALPITVIFERFVAEEVTASILTTYLGRSPARHVLGGVVQAGQGRLVEVVILFGDLRGYTTLSAGLDPRATVALVNAYFDCIVGAVEERGGHLLKFIGDAFLAVFPLEEHGRPICADATISAIREIRIRLSALNRQRADKGLSPLSHGVGVHFGPVIYGNVGASTRLDFTVIGREVNVAARVQEVTKSLGVEYLFTGEYVAAFGDTGLVPIGACELHELDRTIHLYRLTDEPPPRPARCGAAETDPARLLNSRDGPIAMEDS